MSENAVSSCDLAELSPRPPPMTSQNHFFQTNFFKLLTKTDILMNTKRTIRKKREFLTNLTNVTNAMQSADAHGKKSKKRST